MKLIVKTLATAAIVVAVTAAPAAAAPGSPGKAQCEIFGTPVQGGACTKFERTGELNGSAYTQNCRQLAALFGGYPFTFYADGQGPFPPTTAKNQGQCKAALKFFHSSFPG